MYKWYRKCASANVCPEGPLLQEETMKIAKRLEKEGLTDFTASNRLLEKWKQIYGVREKRLCGEEVFTTRVQAWIEKLLELHQDYESRNILNVNELGFFKALPVKVLIEKGKKTKGDKKTKQRMTVMFIVASNSSFIFDPPVICRSKGPCCIKPLKKPLMLMSLQYFSNEKPWMDSDIMESILSRRDGKMCLEKCKVALFWDNATCHPENLHTSLTNLKLIFLPKNTTSRLQLLDASIIRNFQDKYRKLLVRYVVSRIDKWKTASQIIEDAHVFKAITWLQTTWKNVTTETIK